MSVILHFLKDKKKEDQPKESSFNKGQKTTGGSG